MSLIFLALLLAAGCGDESTAGQQTNGGADDPGSSDASFDEDGGSQQDSEASVVVDEEIPSVALIGPDGGVVASGAFRLRIPERALDEPVMISVRAYLAPTDFEGIQVPGVQLLPAGLTFAEPVTLEYDGPVVGEGNEAMAAVWVSPDTTEYLQATAEGAWEGGTTWSVQNTHFCNVYLWASETTLVSLVKIILGSGVAFAEWIVGEVLLTGSVGRAWAQVLGCTLSSGTGWRDGLPCCFIDDIGHSCFSPDLSCDVDDSSATGYACHLNCGGVQWDTARQSNVEVDGANCCSVPGNLPPCHYEGEACRIDGELAPSGSGWSRLGGIGTCEVCGETGTACCEDETPTCRTHDQMIPTSCTSENICCPVDVCAPSDVRCGTGDLGNDEAQYCQQANWGGCDSTWYWNSMDATRCEASSLYDPETGRCCGL